MATPIDFLTLTSPGIAPQRVTLGTTLRPDSLRYTLLNSTPPIKYTNKRTKKLKWLRTANKIETNVREREKGERGDREREEREI